MLTIFPRKRRQTLKSPPPWTPNLNPFLVVIPFYFKDAHTAAELLKWCAELEPLMNRHCLLAYDHEAVALPVIDAARQAFQKVSVFTYDPPLTREWPLGNNHMFEHVAHFISRRFQQPWLLLETDTTPLRRGWLQELEEEYRGAGKPFMGHVVPNMDHMNGQAVYPPNVPAWTALAFNNPEGWAWDINMRPETEAHTHAANELIGHIWNMRDGHPVMCGDGVCPSFSDQSTVDRFITPTMATFHRCKDGSLIHRLRERKAQHAAV